MKKPKKPTAMIQTAQISIFIASIILLITLGIITNFYTRFCDFGEYFGEKVDFYARMWDFILKDEKWQV